MQKNVYFPGLNGLRFIAATLVIIHHIEQIKSIFGFPSGWNNPFVRSIGGVGVTLFFTLSGFLITYLLLKEKKATSSINIQHFYIRRILRIWPLYYLILILAFFVLPHFQSLYVHGAPDINLWQLILFTGLMANVAIVVFPPLEFASQLWSVGVEEQFYLIWPHLVKHIRSIFSALVIIVLLMVIVRYLLIYIHISLPEIIVFEKLVEFMKYFRIDCMAIGGIVSWLYFSEKNTLLNIFYSKLFQWVLYVVLTFSVFFGFKFFWLGLNDVYYSLLFSMVILNVATNPKSILSLEGVVFNFLGKISYGLYMFHPICIVLVISLLRLFNNFNQNFIVFNGLVYLLSIGITIFISWLSYRFVEAKFLNLKSRYTVIENNRSENS